MEIFRVSAFGSRHSPAMRPRAPLVLVSLVLGFFPTARAAGADYVADKDTLVYVGTYTDKPASKGIYLFRLQTQNDEVSQNILLVPMGVAAETPSPAFLDVDVRRRVVFAANELGSADGKLNGA